MRLTRGDKQVIDLVIDAKEVNKDESLELAATDKQTECVTVIKSTIMLSGLTLTESTNHLCPNHNLNPTFTQTLTYLLNPSLNLTLT